MMPPMMSYIKLAVIGRRVDVMTGSVNIVGILAVLDL